MEGKRQKQPLSPRSSHSNVGGTCKQLCACMRSPEKEGTSIGGDQEELLVRGSQKVEARRENILDMRER